MKDCVIVPFLLERMINMLIKEMTVGSAVNVKCLCSEVELITCSNWSKALFLHLKTKDDSFIGKIWNVNTSDVDSTASTYTDKVLDITGKVIQYKGVNEVKITSVKVTDEPASDYISDLDVFSKFLKEHLSENYLSMIKLVFDSIDSDKFAASYADEAHHDNMSGGLVRHTLKMLKIAETVIDNLPDLKSMSDRIYSGIVFHDIGKIWCYSSTGRTTDMAYVDHKAFGIELLSQHKQEIIGLISEDEYYQLLAIILGHHGGYGEPCRSVAALIVHKIDALDAVLTEAVQKLRTVTDANNSIQVNGMRLHI